MNEDETPSNNKPVKVSGELKIALFAGLRKSKSSKNKDDK